MNPCVSPVGTGKAALVVLLLSLGDVAGSFAQSPDVKAWVRVPPPAVGSEARRCANWSDWSVHVATSTDGRLVATTTPVGGTSPSVLAAQPPIPLVSDVPGPGRTLWTRTEEGYFVAFNHGEFGGSLWWYALTGQSRTRIADAAVVAFVPIALRSRNVLVGTIEGLSHLGDSSGSLRLVERGTEGKFAVAAAAKLADAPGAVAPVKDGTLVVTDSSVEKVGLDGAVVKIANVNMSGLYPTSVAQTQDDRIYVGARRYLVQISGRNAPAVRWYTRADCPRFVSDPDRASCRCR